MNELLNKISTILITKRPKFILAFKALYFGIGIFVFISVLFFRTNENLTMFFYEIGKNFGKAAIIAYIATLLPGMGDRFGIKNKVLQIIRIYRRYIGISMYIFAFAHFVFSKLFYLSSITELSFGSTYEIMGVLAFFILLFLFVTSNNSSVGRLRINWFRLQRATYVAMFFIFLHVALNSRGTSTILMGIVVLLQILSFIVSYKKT